MLEFDPLDEYPIHQVPLPMRYVGPSDRNFYDRCIYQGVDHEADAFFITGMGVYPNLGVIDAYATVRAATGNGRCGCRVRAPTTACTRRSVRTASKWSSRSTTMRLVCDADDARHRLRPDVQVRVRPDLRTAARAPHGRPHPARRVALRRRRDVVRRAARRRRDDRGDARALHRDARPVLGHPAGRRSRSRRAGRASSTACGGTGSRCASTTSCCTSSSRRIRAAAQHELRDAAAGPKSIGTAPEQLGWPIPEIDYKSGHPLADACVDGTDGPRREVAHARHHANRRDPPQHRLRIRRRPRLDARRLEGRRLDRRIRLRPQRSGRVGPGRVLDRRSHRAATFDGQTGWGIFEHGNIGKHEPSGFTDMMQVAP